MPTSRHRRKGVTRPRPPRSPGALRIRHSDQRHPECPACNDPAFSPVAELMRVRERVTAHGF